MPGRKGRSGRPKKPVVEDGGEKKLQPKGKPKRPKKISVPTINEEPDSSNVKLTENDESNSENERAPNQSSSKSVQRAAVLPITPYLGSYSLNREFWPKTSLKPPYLKNQ